MTPPPKVHKRSAASDAADVVMNITVDGVDYRLALGNITAKHELELYRQSGKMLTLTGITKEIEENPTGFHLAGLVFLARLSEGDACKFDDVAESMGMTSDIELEIEGDEGDEAGDGPEAIAAS